jgi:hypothetical protein
MNRKWMVFGALAMALLVGLFAVASGVSAQGPGQGPQPMGGRGHGFGGPQNSLVAVAAQVLGMDQPTLVATLNTGKTIADVAKEKGIATDKIVDAFLAARAEMLKTAVAAGRMTQAQADTMLATMKAQATVQLTSKFVPQGNGRGMGFVDANGDGLCDNCGANQPQGRRGPRGR